MLPRGVHAYIYIYRERERETYIYIYIKSARVRIEGCKRKGGMRPSLQVTTKKTNKQSKQREWAKQCRTIIKKNIKTRPKESTSKQANGNTNRQVSKPTGKQRRRVYFVSAERRNPSSKLEMDTFFGDLPAASSSVVSARVRTQQLACAVSCTEKGT